MRFLFLLPMTCLAIVLSHASPMGDPAFAIEMDADGYYGGATPTTEAPTTEATTTEATTTEAPTTEANTTEATTTEAPTTNTTSEPCNCFTTSDDADNLLGNYTIPEESGNWQLCNKQCFLDNPGECIKVCLPASIKTEMKKYCKDTCKTEYPGSYNKENREECKKACKKKYKWSCPVGTYSTA